MSYMMCCSILCCFSRPCCDSCCFGLEKCGIPAKSYSKVAYFVVDLLTMFFATLFVYVFRPLLIEHIDLDRADSDKDDLHWADSHEEF